MAATNLPDALALLRYRDRNRALVAWGKKRSAGEVEKELGALGEGTFEAYCALTAAKAAGAAGVAARLVGHPSAVVRKTSLSCGLLSADDARRLFLSADTSRTVRRALLKSCPSLPCDEETYEAARQMEGADGDPKDDPAWVLLQRTEDGAFFRDRATRGNTSERKLAKRVAARFPDISIDLAGIAFQWDESWITAIAHHDAEKLLRRLIFTRIEHHHQQPPHKIKTFLVRWAWRHQYELMLRLCADTPVGPQSGSMSRFDLLREMNTVRQNYVTFSQRLSAVVAVFKKAGKPEQLKAFVGLLPPCCAKRRSQHCDGILQGFWDMVGSAQPKNPWELFCDLHGKLPDSVLVQEFLQKHAEVRVFSGARDTEAAVRQRMFTAFKFAHGLPDIDDEARLAVFQALLGRADVVTPPFAHDLFGELLKRSTSAPHLRRAFDALSTALGDRAARTVLAAVVAMMEELEARAVEEAKAAGEGGGAAAAPEAELGPVPFAWAGFCAADPPAKDAAAALLRATLLNMCADAAAAVPLRDHLIGTFGRPLFWRLMGVVLRGDGAPLLTRDASAARAAAPLSVLSQLQLQVAAPAGGAGPGGGAVLAKVYMARLSPEDPPQNELVKKKTHGKDFAVRQAGFLELISLARSETDAAKPQVYDDLVPFMIRRMEGEQENVRFDVMQNFMGGTRWARLPELFSAEQWEPRAEEHLGALWKICANTRGQEKREWQEWFQPVASALALRAALAWGQHNASAAAFAARVLLEVQVDGENAFAALFVAAHKAAKERGRPLHADAMEWIVAGAVEAAERRGEQQREAPPAAQTLLELLGGFARVYPYKGKSGHGQCGSQQRAWEALPGLRRRWDDAAGRAAETGRGLEVVLSQAVVHMVHYNSAMRAAVEGDEETYEEWWAPLRVEAYEAAVSAGLRRIAALEMRPAWAMSVLESRLMALDADGAGALRTDKAVAAVCAAAADVVVGVPAARVRELLFIAARMGINHLRLPEPTHGACAARNSTGVWSQRARLRALHRRPPCTARDDLLSAALRRVDAAQEGRARVAASGNDDIAAQLGGRKGGRKGGRSPRGGKGGRKGGGKGPSARSRGGGGMMPPALVEHQEDQPVSALLDRYLACGPAQREERVAELCRRPDAPALLFFSDTLARHLLQRQQDLLHDLLGRLRDPPPPGEQAEWYHWELPEHSLPRICALGPPSMLLHAKTQDLLLRKGILSSTRLENLKAMTKMLYVDTTEHVQAVLDANGREQSKAPKDAGAAGADGYEGAAAPSCDWSSAGGSVEGGALDEADRRFASLPPPVRTDQVGQHEVDELVLALGRADHMDRSLAVLSRYADKNKMARTALMTTIPSLSVAHARRVLREVITQKGMGVGGVVQALRLVVDLRVERPLEIYEVAWRGGRCHNDMAVAVLTKLALGPPLGADDVATARGLYDTAIVHRAEDRDKTYVCDEVLKQIQHKPWSLPFLCDIVAQWAFVPGMTQLAFSSLQGANGSGVSATAHAAALARVLESGRLLRDAELHDDHTLARAWDKVCPRSVARTLASRGLDDCEFGVLQTAVREVWRSLTWKGVQEDLKAGLELWAQMLRGESFPSISNWDPDASENGKALQWVKGQLQPLLRQSAPETIYATLADVATSRAIALHAKGIVCVRTASEVQIEAWKVSGKRARVDLMRKQWTRLLSACALGPGGGMMSEPLQRSLKEWFTWSWENLFGARGQKEAGEHAEEVARAFFQFQQQLHQQQLATVNLRWQVLEWLSDQDCCAKHPRGGLDTLTDLCALHIRMSMSTHAGADARAEAECQKVFELFQQKYSTSDKCVKLVQQIETQYGQASLRGSLKWLARLFPRDAVRLWPRLLRVHAPQPADVAALLDVCKEHGIAVPAVPKAAALLSINFLFDSPLAEARLQGVRTLSELKDEALPPAPRDHQGARRTRSEWLEVLVKDASPAVSTVAGDVLRKVRKEAAQKKKERGG